MSLNYQELIDDISRITGRNFKLESVRPCHGGDINSCYELVSRSGSYFIKQNRSDLLSMFEAEYAALQALAATALVKVPSPICVGVSGSRSYLVLEFIEWGPGSKSASRILGTQLANLHQLVQPHFGWIMDNTIGSSPQINNAGSDWIQFWRDYRLGFQLQLAAQNGYRGKLQELGNELRERLPAFFTTYQPQASLLHGDLWGGNTAVDKRGEPYIFDPASYFGDREADLAMTELFGGFGTDFYAAYQDTWPLDSGYATRKQLYNLYHILNHLNLFGGSYLSQAQNCLLRLLAECR